MVTEIDTNDQGRPRPAEGPIDRRRRYAHLAVAALIVVVDQLTKAWAVARLDDDVIDLALGIKLRLVRNTGFAFSQGTSLGPLIAVVAAIVVVVLWRMGRTFGSNATLLALGLVLGGACGNLIDRIFRSGDGFLGGAVIDFVDLGWWPVFNVADAAIVIGAALLALVALRRPAP